MWLNLFLLLPYQFYTTFEDITVNTVKKKSILS